MKLFPHFALGLTLAASVAIAQNAPTQPAPDDLAKLPRFEVATIKPTPPNTNRSWGPNIYPGARVAIYSMPLKSLISLAFDLPFPQISGGDAWIEKDAYDIEAKPPAEMVSSIRNLRSSWMYGIEDEHLRRMLQALLIDRFELQFHRASKTGSVYVLERSGKPLVMRPTRAASLLPNPSEPAFSGSIGFAGGQWTLFNAPMSQLAKFAANYVVHAPVVDRTGIEGSFDYRQPRPLPDSEVNYSDNTDSFLRLIPELGLKLERTTRPVEMFMIDRVEKPTAN